MYIYSWDLQNPFFSIGKLQPEIVYYILHYFMVKKFSDKKYYSGKTTLKIFLTPVTLGYKMELYNW